MIQCRTRSTNSEPSKSPMHLAEFLMPEWEIIGGGLIRNMSVAQFVLKHMFRKVLKHCKYELEFLEEHRSIEESIYKK